MVKIGRLPPLELVKRKGFCPYCRLPSPGSRTGRRVWHETCVTAWKVATQSEAQKDAAMRNCGGKCQGCGTVLRTVLHKSVPGRVIFPNPDDARRYRFFDPPDHGWPEGSYIEVMRFGVEEVHWRKFEADHVVPLWTVDRSLPWSEIGRYWGESNLQALCVPCHRLKTAGEASLRAELKRTKKDPE